MHYLTFDTNTWIYLLANGAEINIFGQTIRFAQYAGQPFFGEFTDEVVEYCKENHWALK